MIVVPYKPWRSMLLTLCVLFVVLAGGYYGFTRGANESIDVRIERDQLSTNMSVLKVQIGILQQNLTNADLASLVDSQALLEVRDMLVGLREINAQLEEEVFFYRQVMSPENDESGVAIGPLKLHATEEEGRIRYHIELKQFADNQTVNSGYANVNILGMQNGNEVSFPLSIMAPEESQLDIRLQFRYFQNIEGELIIPDNFMPEIVQIKAVFQGEDSKTIQRNFVWVVEG